MLLGAVIAQMRVVAGSTVSLVGVAGTSATFAGTSFSVTIPAGAAIGDTLIAMLRCRSDRSFSTPAGWTLNVSTFIGTSPSADVNTRLYVMSKTYAGEPTATFVQSVSAAGIAVVAVVRGTFGQHVVTAGTSGSITPANSASMLLAIGTSNNTTISDAVWTAPFNGLGSFKWAASTPYFYGVAVATHLSGATDQVTSSFTWPHDAGSPGANYSVVIEVLPLA